MGSQAILIALASHTGFGLYVVMSKDLFKHFPPFGLLACAFGCALLTGAWIFRKDFEWKDVLRVSVWSVAGIAILRSLTKMLAIQYTLAVHVQLLGLSIPFISAILARIFLREKMPRGTIPALIATTLGAYFVITINPLKPDLIIRYVDLTGLALALVSSILMAILVVITSFSTQVQSNPVNVYLQQTTALTVTYLSLSIFTKESWAPFLHLNFSYLGYLLVFFAIVFIAGGLTVSAISKVNTTIFSSLLSLRLVVVLVAGWFILGEQLTSVYQYSGAALIIVAITWYLWRQNISNENQSERKMQDFTIDGSRR